MLSSMVAKYASIRHPINLVILAPAVVLEEEVGTTREALASKAIKEEEEVVVVTV